ncbi:AraC family ligand binding domain-containing protein [Paenibacillus cremeus]|uniref:Cupin domain-containing protein n=1 Tax=Paenibacillus cremeus TaxID=2163881 RepID=A0A559KEJ0_9BACL|nr:AraC family ligand binding domain-containing protein [Paenibacillus cremeus]TVY10538.1 cupin domain-containing protein [Paenibacillus cremeus]
MKGQLEIWIEDEQYDLREGDLFLIGPSELHRDRCPDPSCDGLTDSGLGGGRHGSGHYSDL